MAEDGATPAPVSVAPAVPPVRNSGVMALAFLVLLGFFGMLGCLFFVQVPSENLNTVNLVVGFVGGIATAVVSYYFGASATGDAVQLQHPPSGTNQGQTGSA